MKRTDKQKVYAYRKFIIECCDGWICPECHSTDGMNGEECSFCADCGERIKGYSPPRVVRTTPRRILEIFSSDPPSEAQRTNK